MGLAKSGDVASRFSAYVEGLTSVIGHANRAKPLRDYCTGLMMPCDRKSVEPMAAITAPDRTAAQHQALPSEPPPTVLPPGTFRIIGPELATYGVVQPICPADGVTTLGTFHERVGDAAADAAC